MPTLNPNPTFMHFTFRTRPHQQYFHAVQQSEPYEQIHFAPHVTYYSPHINHMTICTVVHMSHREFPLQIPQESPFTHFILWGRRVLTRTLLLNMHESRFRNLIRISNTAFLRFNTAVNGNQCLPLLDFRTELLRCGVAQSGVFHTPNLVPKSNFSALTNTYNCTYNKLEPNSPCKMYAARGMLSLTETLTFALRLLYRKSA